MRRKLVLFELNFHVSDDALGDLNGALALAAVISLEGAFGFGFAVGSGFGAGKFSRNASSMGGKSSFGKGNCSICAISEA